MRGEALRGQLDLLLLAVVRARPAHGCAIIENLYVCAVEESWTFPRGQYTRPCTGWSEPVSSRADGRRPQGAAGAPRRSRREASLGYVPKNKTGASFREP